MSWRWLVLVLAALSLNAQQAPPPGRGVNFYNREKEAALGAMLAREVSDSSTKLDNPELQGYVERLGRRLAAQLPDGGFSFHFTIVAGDPNNRTHEPLALPGGYVFVPALLILAAQDEAEFAGMLAHAMVHVIERHGSRPAVRGQLANMSNIPLIFIGGWVGGSDEAALVPIGFLKSMRAFELDADRLAAIGLAKAGYDPAALVRYISREQPELSEGRRSYSNLPPRATRIAALEEVIQAIPAGDYSASDEFPRIQETVRRSMPEPPALEEDGPPRMRRPPTLRRNDPQ